MAIASPRGETRASLGPGSGPRPRRRGDSSWSRWAGGAPRNGMPTETQGPEQGCGGCTLTRTAVRTTIGRGGGLAADEPRFRSRNARPVNRACDTVSQQGGGLGRTIREDRFRRCPRSTVTICNAGCTFGRQRGSSWPARTAYQVQGIARRINGPGGIRPATMTANSGAGVRARVARLLRRQFRD